jgi:hypothetical protein
MYSIPATNQRRAFILDPPPYIKKAKRYQPSKAASQQTKQPANTFAPLPETHAQQVKRHDQAERSKKTRYTGKGNKKPEKKNRKNF